MQLVLIALLGLAASARGEDDAVVIRLASGDEVIGSIVEFDPDEGISLTRFDNGGLLRLVWDQVLEDDVRMLRRMHGYINDEAEAPFRDAHELTFTNGRKQVGIIVNREGETISLKSRGRVLDYQKTRVMSIESVRVEALDVYLSDELYQEQVMEKPPETPLEHYNTGIFCESIERYDLALTHFERASEIDGSFQPEDVARKTRLCQLRIEKKDQTDYLKKIKSLIYQKNFDRAQEMADGFETQFPGSELNAEAMQLKVKAGESQRKHVTQRISRDFLTALDSFCGKVSRNADFPLNPARQVIRDEAAAEVFAILGRRYKLDPSVIENMWSERAVKSTLKRSYGGGTFVLGSSALDGMGDGEEKEKTQKPEEESDGGLMGRVKKIIEKRREEQKKRRKGPRRGVADVGLSPEEWYAQATSTERRFFLMAWFAEETEYLNIKKVGSRACSQCYGNQKIDIIDREQGAISVTCPRCKGLGVDRVVTFQ